MTAGVWAGIGAQLRLPHGMAGRLTGHAMRLANARANALAVARLAPEKGERILELGCGPGQALRRILAHDVAHAMGIDHSAIMIAQARRNNADAMAGGRLSLCYGDITTLPLDDASMDGVLAVNVAYFMRDASGIAEARRVLKPGGRLVLYVTSAEAMRSWRFAGPHTHRLFTPAELIALLNAGGFATSSIGVDSVNAAFGVTGLIAIATREGSPPEESWPLRQTVA